MSNFRLISAILNSHWLVNEQWAESNLSYAQSLLEGNGFPNEQQESKLILDSRLTRYQYREGWNGAPKGSFAFYDINGPILHYGYCGDGTDELHRQFKEADQNPNISAHFFLMDTPGGQADGIKEFADSIKNGSKPTLVFGNGGMIASGGGWIASAADYTFVSSDLFEIGSYGAYSTLIDSSERDQREGVKRIVIRARQSHKKNTVYELAKSGDKEALKELEDRISVVAESFITSVASNRADRLTTDDWNTGDMYYAPKALEMGLIDGICTMEDALDHLSNQTKKTKSKKNIGMKFQNLSALAEKDSATQEELDLANADLTAAGITSFTLVEQSVIDEGARVTQELATANADLETANATIAANVIALEQNKAEITQLKNVIANRAAADNGIKTKADPTKEAEIKSGDDKKIAAHNQAADKSFF
ncbi:S49 family peptidase [Sphingobacterium spiritivorum]|uniref:S49 family peptidase n=1 Tax=Sphingobacterium spiritivorum TaxID=258 RepID=UPI003F76389D